MSRRLNAAGPRWRGALKNDPQIKRRSCGALDVPCRAREKPAQLDGEQMLEKIRQLHGPQPEMRKFTGFGLRSPLIATQYLGYDYSYFFADGSHPKNPQTKHHRHCVDRSRFRGLAPAQ